jgi:selenocysteine lyase/cysteine desulfurase
MIYLNNAASAWPKAPGVAEAMTEEVSSLPKHPGRTVTAADRYPDACRTRMARLLGVDRPGCIVLTQHATHALNLAILGLDLKAGDEAVTTVAEHNSMLRPLARLEDLQGIRLTIIGLTPEGTLDEGAFERALAREPRLVAFNHASNVTGQVLPVAECFARAHRAGAVTLLDASQSLGHIPVNAAALHADLIAFTGHKGLRGPAGTGGLYVREGLELEQVIVGGTGIRSDLRLHPTEMPTRLEAGTPNMPALAGLATALHWGEEQGTAFEAVAADRAAKLRAGLSRIPGVRLFGDGKPPWTGIVSFRIDGWMVEETGYALAESFGIVCRTGLHCAPLIHAAVGSAPEGTVRFSPSGATTEQEIEEAIAAIRRMAG